MGGALIVRKRAILFIAAGALLLSLAACNSQPTNSSQKSSQKGNEPVSSISSVIPEDSSKVVGESPSPSATPTAGPKEKTESSQNEEEVLLQISVGGQVFLADLASTEAAQSLSEMLPMSLEMSDWQSTAKVFELPSVMPEAAEEYSQVPAGQLLLKGSGSLYLFYQTSDQPENYTPIAIIQDPTGLSQALSGETMEVSFQLIMS